MTDDQVVLADRYSLGDRLGRGGMADVRRGFDLRLERTVAVKCLKVELAADPSFQERFRREAHAVAGLNHPGIAAVYDTGEQVDERTGVPVPFLVMELVDGPTLRDVLRDRGPLPPGRALELTRVVLNALAHSHAAGIVHRDIKPSNIMLTPKGDAKVMDFGIARAAAETSSGLTGTATVIGTAHYLSPEQARGERVDQRSDLYSTGCLLYELLLGRPPFLGDSSVSVAYQHVREMPVPPSQVDPRLGPDLDNLITRALAKDPADRYQSADEMAADIGRVLTGLPALAATPSERDQDTHVTPVVPASVPSPATEVAAEATHGLPTGSTVLASTVPAASAAPAVGFAPPGDADPPTEPDRRRGGRGLLVALLTLLVLAGLGLGAYWVLSPGATDLVSVPSVLESTREEAEQVLRGAGLQPAFRHVDGPGDDTVGTVIGQTPEQGVEVEPGRTVTAEINVGPATEEIPENLVGRDVDKVLDELREAGFSNVTSVPVENAPKGAEPDEVVRVEPGEGEKAAPEEDIVVSYVGRASRAPTTGPRSQPSGGGDTEEPPATTEKSTAQEETEKQKESTESAEPGEEESTKKPSAEPSESEEPGPSASAEPSGSEPASEAPSGPPSDQQEEEVVKPPVSIDPAEVSQPPGAP